MRAKPEEQAAGFKWENDLANELKEHGLSFEHHSASGLPGAQFEIDFINHKTKVGTDAKVDMTPIYSEHYRTKGGVVYEQDKVFRVYLSAVEAYLTQRKDKDLKAVYFVVKIKRDGKPDDVRVVSLTKVNMIYLTNGQQRTIKMQGRTFRSPLSGKRKQECFITIFYDDTISYEEFIQKMKKMEETK